MRWLWFAVVVLGVGLGGSGEARAFTMGEAMGTAAVQGTLARQSSSGVAGLIGGVRQSVNQAVGAYNQQRVSVGLGGNVPSVGAGPGGTRWMTAGTEQAVQVTKSWATVEGGIGGTSGWKIAEAFQDTAGQAWATPDDGWAKGGIVP